MNNFRTQIDIPHFPFSINHRNKLLFLGSCFSENIGEKLIQSKFQVNLNPFGVIYNPESVKNSIEILIEKKVFSDIDLQNENGIWYSFFHHSRFSDIDKNKCLENINQNIEIGHEFLKKADYIFLTFGTAFIYSLIENGKTVSNCHKLPANKFIRKMLGIEMIIEMYKEILQKIYYLNPKAKIIMTVSPVRHQKDGHSQNLISKSILVLAIQKLVESFENIFYFPAFEIMNDDLRDYRFYEPDMVHPNSTAIDYIWNIFKQSFFDIETNDRLKKFIKLHNLRCHKPRFPGSFEFKRFISSSETFIYNLEKEFPFLNFESEKIHFEKLMQKH